MIFWSEKPYLNDLSFSSRLRSAILDEEGAVVSGPVELATSINITVEPSSLDVARLINPQTGQLVGAAIAAVFSTENQPDDRLYLGRINLEGDLMCFNP